MPSEKILASRLPQAQRLSRMEGTSRGLPDRIRNKRRGWDSHDFARRSSQGNLSLMTHEARPPGGHPQEAFLAALKVSGDEEE